VLLPLVAWLPAAPPSAASRTPTAPLAAAFGGGSRGASATRPDKLGAFSAFNPWAAPPAAGIFQLSTLAQQQALFSLGLGLGFRVEMGSRQLSVQRGEGRTLVHLRLGAVHQ
jgi:hypothetical protein